MKTLLILMLMLLAGTAHATLPTLPAVLVDTSVPTTSITKTVCASGCDYNNSQLQTAIDAAVLGTTIQLEAGVEYNSGSDNGYILKNKASGSGWIVITTNTTLPAHGVRVTPATAVNYAKITGPSNYFITAENNAHHYRLMGVEVRKPGNTNTSPPAYTYVFVNLDPSSTTTGTQPHHIIVDRAYIHNPVPVAEVQTVANTGVQFGGYHMAVIDSYIDNIYAYGNDCKAVSAWNGTGPYKIVNNFLGAECIPIFFGGATPATSGDIPSDIEIRRNHIYKNPVFLTAPWLTCIGSPCSQITKKNMLELKNAKRVLIDANIIENSHYGDQKGSGIHISPRGGAGCSPIPSGCVDAYTEVSDITITNNWLNNVNDFVSISGQDNGVSATQVGHRFLYQNNLVTGLGFNSGAFSEQGNDLDTSNGATDLTVNHNTVVAPISLKRLMTLQGDPTTQGAMTNTVVTNNIFIAGWNTVYWDLDQGSPAATYTFYMPSYVWTKNVLVGPWPTAGGFSTSMMPSSSGATNYYPANEAAIQYTNLAGGDYSLAVGSPYHNLATDATPTDIGVNWTTLQAAIAGVLAGTAEGAPVTSMKLGTGTLKLGSGALKIQ